MRELAEILSTLFRKISDFFDILDLSFFVSGLFGLVPLAVWVMRTGQVEGLQQAMGPFLFGLTLIVGTYVTGLMCFACGRAVRRMVRRIKEKLGRGGGRGFGEYVEGALRSHGLHNDPGIVDYLARRPERADSLMFLYVRMWAKLRETSTLTNSFVLVKRYWIMAAIYDGLGFALLLWLGTGVAWKLLDNVDVLRQWRWGELLLVFGGLAFVTWTCFQESARLGHAQVDELVATLALLDPTKRIIWTLPEQTPASKSSTSAPPPLPASSLSLPVPELPPPPPPPAKLTG